MQLKSMRITNFRSVEDSGLFTLEQATCLVGKNEAGKTAILQALAGLNPHPSTDINYDKERDYPRRHLGDYEARHKGGEATVIETIWALTPVQKAALADMFGATAITADEVTILRRYNEEAKVVVPLDEAQALANLIGAERLNAAELSVAGKLTTETAFRKAISDAEAPTEKHARVVARLDAFVGGSMIEAFARRILSDLPHFMYFSHYDRMAGQIQLSNFAQRLAAQAAPPVEAGERVFVDFLQNAGTSLDEINSATTFEGLNARCEAASNRITEQLNEYWTQNPHLEIEVRVTKGESADPAPFNSGVVARARVKNNLHRVSVPFSERSAGFIWFFSFLVKFAEVRKATSNLVLLLDEPGLTLHGKAQADLLRYFDEKLSPHHQIVFSTHSPFMVPADKLHSVRIVEDHIVLVKPNRLRSDGTKVSADALVVDPDTLFPLQGALGYDITQSLFVGKNTLLLEGPGDILYLQALSAELGRRKRTTLNERWTLCPAGGIDKIQSFVALFSGQNLHIAAITDFAKADRRKLETLQKTRLLENDRLKTFATVLGVDEADVEDIFDVETFVRILNASFSLPAAVEAKAPALMSADATTTRLLKKAEAYFRTLPPEAPEFDHFTPAYWLLSTPSFLAETREDLGRTLDRAEAVIAAINSMLPADA